MEILNKKHPSIINAVASPKNYSISYHGRGRLYFAKDACDLCGLKEGKYIHFMPDEKSWFFFMNDDDSGFRLLKNNKGLFVQQKALGDIFVKKTGAKLYYKYYIKPTKSVQNDVNPVWEIIIHKTYANYLASIGQGYIKKGR